MRRDRAVFVGFSVAARAGHGGGHGYTVRAELDRTTIPLGTPWLGGRAVSPGSRNHDGTRIGGWTRRIDALDGNGRAAGFQGAGARTGVEESRIEETIEVDPTAFVSFSGTTASDPRSGAAIGASTLGATPDTPL